MVVGTFGGGGSVAAFDSDNGLRRGDGDTEMLFDCGGGGWRPRFTAAFDGGMDDGSGGGWRRQLAKMLAQQRRRRQCNEGIGAGAMMAKTPEKES